MHSTSDLSISMHSTSQGPRLGTGTVVLAVVTAELPLAIKPRDCVSIFLRYNRVVLVLVAKLGMDVHLGVPESSAKKREPMKYQSNGETDDKPSH